MRVTNQELRSANLNYCFEIKLENNQLLFLTSAAQNIKNNNIIYHPNSGLNILEAFFNDTARDHVLLEGIFEKQGINKEMNLVSALVKIFIVISGHFQELVTYKVSEYSKYDLNFIIRLEPETIKYNQTIINKYSKTCRANFGDAKCGIDKELHSVRARIIKIIGQNIILSDLVLESGYFTGGSAHIREINFCAKILTHYKDTIKLDKIIELSAHKLTNIILTASCDKKFITCCNKFNNTVNFRGEPFIPDQNFLKII